MNLNSQIQLFWEAFLTETGRDPNTPVYDVFHFDDNKSDSNKLTDLVLRGRKLATASLLWKYESSGKRQPQAGDLSVVTDWVGSPICVIETVEVRVHAFEEVDKDFADAEGEGA